MKITSSLKIFLLIPIFITLSMNAYSSHSFHNWDKISEFKSEQGKTVCEWLCDPIMGDAHTKITSGYGYCNRPF